MIVLLGCRRRGGARLRPLCAPKPVIQWPVSSPPAATVAKRVGAPTDSEVSGAPRLYGCRALTHDRPATDTCHEIVMAGSAPPGPGPAPRGRAARRRRR